MIGIRSSFRSGRFGLRLLAPAVGAAAALALLVPSLAGAATQTDTSVADFAAGTPGATTYVSDMEVPTSGEVILAPTVGEEFAGGLGLPTGWSSGNMPPWTGGTATVAGGALHVDGAFAGTTDIFARPRSLEFRATFSASTSRNQHVGFGEDFNTPNWAIFSTRNPDNNPDPTQLWARTNVGGAPMTDIPVGAPGQYTGTSHRYRIEWTVAGVNFFIDGVPVATGLPSPTVNLRPLVSDLDTDALEVAVDWLHMSPYTTPGTFDSRVFDAGQGSDWGALSWIADTPAGTGVALSVRTGNTAVPDGTWSAFAPVANGADIAASSRYLQYSAGLTTSDATQTPTLGEVSIAYEPTPPPAVTTTPPAVAGPVAQTHKKNCKKIKNKKKRKKCKKKQRN